MHANVDTESADNAWHCVVSRHQHEADTRRARAHSTTACVKAETKAKVSPSCIEGTPSRTAVKNTRHESDLERPAKRG